MDTKGFCVGDLMCREVRMVKEDASLEDAAKLMQRWKVSSLVVDKEDASDAYGIVTRKDIVAAFLSEMTGMEPSKVREVMTKPAITVSPNLALSQCIRLMTMASVRRLPVEKDGELVGILSNSDVFFWCLENLLKESQPPAEE